MARSTAERVAHQHRDSHCNEELVRVVQPIKPYISYDIRDLRVEFAYWISERAQNGAIFIFVDETYIHLGGHPRKKPKIIKSRGTDSHQFARHDPPEQFQLMLWAAIGPYEDEIPFPYWIQEAETEEEKKNAQEKLNELNAARKQKIISKQFNAKVSKTKEFNILQEINTNIVDHNKKLRAEGYRGRQDIKHVRKAKQIFKFIELKRENANGGID